MLLKSFNLFARSIAKFKSKNYTTAQSYYNDAQHCFEEAEYLASHWKVDKDNRIPDTFTDFTNFLLNKCTNWSQHTKISYLDDIAHSVSYYC